MTGERQAKIAKNARTVSAILICLCVAILTFSYIGARTQKTKDDARIFELQEQIREDSSLAPTLAEFHEEVTKSRLARKASGNVISIILIVVASVFLLSAKHLLASEGRRPIEMSKLIRIKTSPATGKKKAGSDKPSTSDGPPEIDLSFVDETVARVGKTAEAAIPILQAIQNHYRYLPDEALTRVCELTEITPAQVAGTSSFYAQFRRSPVGEHIVRVCHGTACHVSGARQITDEIRRHLAIPNGEDTDADRMYTVDEVACLGCCSLAPVLMVDGHTAGKLTPATACEAIHQVREEEPA